MRVLLLNQTYLPDPVATSQYLGRWAEHLAHEGHEVTVLAGRRAYQDMRTQHPARETRGGVRIIRVPTAGGAGRSRLARGLGFVSFLLAVLVRGFFLRKPDVIVALTSPPLLPAPAAILARLRGARLMVWAMDLHPEAAIAAKLLQPDGLAAKLARIVSRWSLRRAARVVTLDDHMRRRIMGQGVPGTRVDVVPLWMHEGVAFDPVGRATTRRMRGWDDKFVVMCAGNHGACHSMETMLAAAEALRGEPAIHFCWVGGGVQWNTLRDHAARNVSLLGYVPREKLAALLSAADLQVVVMGDEFTGLLHPCKIYNVLATRRPLLYVGPAEGPVPDVIRAAQLGEGAFSARHGDRESVIREIRRRSKSPGVALPAGANLTWWRECSCLEKMTSALGHAGRFPLTVDESPCPSVFRPDHPGVGVPAPGGTGAGHQR